jgi:hypothetical protein
MLNNCLASKKLQPLKVLGADTKRICGSAKKFETRKWKNLQNREGKRNEPCACAVEDVC